jgi:FG-GAP-like repeat
MFLECRDSMLSALAWLACAAASAAGCGDAHPGEPAGVSSAALTQCRTNPSPHPCADAVCTQGDDGTFDWAYEPYPDGTPCGNGGHCEGSSELCIGEVQCSASQLAAATGTLVATPSTVSAGLSTTLRWSVNAWSGCWSQLKLDGAPVPTTGYQTQSPAVVATHTLKLGSRTLATAGVSVTSSNDVHIDGSTSDWAAAFVEAVGASGKTVILRGDVDLDLTGYENIWFGNGVTVTSSAPHSAQNRGPRIFTTSRPRALFSIGCNGSFRNAHDTRLLGFRFEGPDPDTMDGDQYLEQGIHVGSCLGVEIADMEISGWSGQAILIEDEAGYQISVDAVNVHDNYIHNNQHEGGNGYGVALSSYGHARIERNVFDFNRHAIMSSGLPRNSYLANQNLVLKGGGVHGRFYNTYTQQFDVHGTEDCYWFLYPEGCGTAGYEFWITGNAFQYTHDNAVKIRGTPVKAATIVDNVFTQSSIGDAVGTTQGLENIYNWPNTLGVDTFGEYGVCDFDGDGRDDLFLATGVSWWYMSGAEMHWVYLKPATERLSQVGLGDFDKDGRCDVFALNTGNSNWEISSGGNGPWTALPGNYAGIPFDQLRFGDFNNDGVTDVFYRAGDGQWWAISPGYYGWTALESSGFELSAMRLGDFDGDGVTDVLSHAGGHWSVSWGATNTWQSTGSGLNDDFQNAYIGNVDGLPGDDLVRYVATDRLHGQWQISSGAKTHWQSFAWNTFPEPGSTAPDPSLGARTFLGRFRTRATTDLLMIDDSRRSRIFSAGASGFVPYGLTSY